MYDCPECGAGLRYDIEKAALFCDHCGHLQDPYTYEKERDAEESDSFGVNVFVCPQCGGEIMTTDVTAAAFCTYCGASTILDSRMKEEKRPAQIIPFTRTKEDCCNAYRKFTRMALFTPRELRDPEYLSQFRGIYMPYWIYSFGFHNKPAIHGTKQYRKGNYVYTDHYNLTCSLNASYDGLAYDASSSFDDAVSMSIAPYPAEQLKPFTPAFLSGFFADSPDVEAKEYTEFAKEECCADVAERILDDPEFSKYTVDRSETGFDRNLHPAAEKPRCAYLPVWFLTYRKKDRVAYAVMNGVTGKISADLPVEPRKFLLGSLVLSVPLFFLLNLLMTLTPSATLAVASCFAAFSLLLYLLEIGAISSKEKRDRDLGFLSARAQSQTSKTAQEAQQFKDERKAAANELRGKTGKRKRGGIKKTLSGIMSLLFVCLFAVTWIYGTIDSSGFTFSLNAKVLVGAAALLTTVVIEIIILGGASDRSETAGRSLLPHTVGACLASVVSFIILFLNPADDRIFYGATIVSFAGICATLLGILGKYNLLATRPLPTFFDREGGDDKPVRGYALDALLPFLPLAVSVPLAAGLLGGGLLACRASASDAGTLYQNSGTGYTVTIDDEEDLLSDSEEEQLLENMIPITSYGNVVFVSAYVQGNDTDRFAQDYYYGRFGNASGTILLIDMNNRMIKLLSSGAVYRVITRGYANSITDNSYRYASYGQYYRCASTVFAQVTALLEGGRITQPMKYICNALLAIILAMLFNYGFVRFLMRRKRPSHDQIMGAAIIDFRYSEPVAKFARSTKVYDPPAKGGHGGGGGSRGGGGGGFSGGGGGHRF